MENYYSLSDIKSIMGDEGMGGGWFLIVILFLFLFGFGGMGMNRNCGPGNCGNDGYVTTSQFESENNFRTLDNSNRMTQNGLCQLGYEQANLINSSTAQIVGNITGEGWFLTAEMVELIHSGAPSIACVQPFACGGCAEIYLVYDTIPCYWL